ncbi:MAG: mandelate racemase/muconate lactonizing enzyme family protein [Lautropia sp.]
MSAAKATIEGFATHLVVLPLAEPIRHPFMGARTQFATMVLEVRTREGAVGLGYASVENLRMVQAVESIVHALEPHLAGEDALRRAFLYERMYGLTVDLLHDGAVNLALAAIDTALWDLCGRVAGLPLWRLLGGYREAVPAYASWTLWRHMDVDRLETETAAIVARGFNAMKLRMGGGRPLADDVERARAVRRVAGPDAVLMVDALWGLTVEEGLRMADALAELGYAWLEEPVRENDFAGLAQIRDRRALPIAAGERISRVEHVPALLPAVDHPILDAHHLGGVTPWLKAAAHLDAANRPISSHSHPFVHLPLLAAVRTGAWLEYMPWWDALFVDPPTPQAGLLPAGERPGLGLTLDRGALARHRPG